jgi:cytochrome d ubiquinol oxidase subunit I
MQALPFVATGSGSSAPDLLWARELQTLSFTVHIPLACFAMAFPAMVLFAEWRWLRTGERAYRTLAERWSKVMLVLFSVGVVTGTILSFELGLLWPEFMGRFGEVFGLAFGLEGFAFFAEAIFIAIYVYGWEHLAPKAHLLSGIPVVLAAFGGSLCVISVSGWMNNPVGFDLVDGRVSNVRPWRALFNDYLWHEYVHMYVAALMVTGFLVAGAYARPWLRGDRGPYVRAALAIPLTVAALAAPAQLVVGDWAGRSVAVEQPAKLAAFEGLPHSTARAPVTIGGWYSEGEVHGGLEIPALLSLLSRHDPNAEVPGLDVVPPQDRPRAINTVRTSFQVMVSIGILLAGLGVFYLVVRWRHRRLPRGRRFYRLLVAAGPLAVVALLCGWVTTEVGRQPWIVYEVMRTGDAVTRARGLPYIFVAVLAVYLALATIAWWSLRRLRAPRPAPEPRAQVMAE